MRWNSEFWHLEFLWMLVHPLSESLELSLVPATFKLGAIPAVLIEFEVERVLQIGEFAELNSAHR